MVRTCVDCQGELTSEDKLLWALFNPVDTPIKCQSCWNVEQQNSDVPIKVNGKLLEEYLKGE